jgi:hypothetical protein
MPFQRYKIRGSIPPPTTTTSWNGDSQIISQVAPRLPELNRGTVGAQALEVWRARKSVGVGLGTNAGLFKYGQKLSWLTRKLFN